MVKIFSSLALLFHIVFQSVLAVTLDPVDSGIFSFRQEGGGLGGGITVTHSSLATELNFNYQIISAGNGERFQSGFAIYDLSGVSGAVVGASLEMQLIESTLEGPGFPPPFPPPTINVNFRFNQVDSDPALFDSSYSESNSIFCVPNCIGLGDGFDIFRDLRDGPELGSVSYGDTTGSRSTGLGGPSLELLNQAAGDLFVIGIVGGPGGFNNYNGSLRLARPQLTLELAPVPLPAAFLLFATALAGLFAFRSRIRS